MCRVTVIISSFSRVVVEWGRVIILLIKTTYGLGNRRVTVLLIKTTW